MCFRTRILTGTESAPSRRHVTARAGARRPAGSATPSGRCVCTSFLLLSSCSASWSPSSCCRSSTSSKVRQLFIFDYPKARSRGSILCECDCDFFSAILWNCSYDATAIHISSMNSTSQSYRMGMEPIHMRCHRHKCNGDTHSRTLWTVTLTSTQPITVAFTKKHRVNDPVWFIYIAGYRYRYRLGFGFKARWLHCTMQKISHCTDSDSDPFSLFVYRTGIRVQVCTRVDLQPCKWPIRVHL